MGILELFPLVLTGVEIIKRFIPDKRRDIANPILAIALGLLGAYATGGTEELTAVLMTGVGAGAAAIGAYKVPKVVAPSIVDVIAGFFRR